MPHNSATCKKCKTNRHSGCPLARNELYQAFLPLLAAQPKDQRAELKSEFQFHTLNNQRQMLNRLARSSPASG